MRLDIFNEALIKIQIQNKLDHEGEALKIFLDISDSLSGQDWEVQSLNETAEAVLAHLRADDVEVVS